VQIKKIGREAVILEEKSQKCNWCRYFCKIFLLIQIVSGLIHLWRFTANHSIATLAWVRESCLQTFGRTSWMGDQLIMKLQPTRTTQAVSKCRKLAEW